MDDKYFIDGFLALTSGRDAAFRKRHGFSSNSAKIWARAACRCEYCGQSLTESMMAYYSYQYDHILPVSRYRGNPFVDFTTSDLFRAGRLSQEQLNSLALSCRLCNSIKSAFDPNKLLQVYTNSGPLDNDTRSKLIEEVQKFVGPIRREYEEMFETVRAYCGNHLATITLAMRPR